MTIFAIVGSSILGAIMIWFGSAQRTTGESTISKESQYLAGYFVGDVSSATLVSQTSASCVSLSVTPLVLTWATPSHAYQSQYTVVGTTLQRWFTVDGGTPTKTTVADYLQAGTPPCVSSIGATRTLTVATAFPQLANFTYSITGAARSPFAVTVGAPANGGSTNATTPMFTGSAGSFTASAPVTVKVYAGTTTTGTLVQTLTATPSGGSWSVAPTTALAGNATYTVQASEGDGAGNTGVSSANTFVIDTVNPAVTLTAPANGTAIATTTPTFSGSAGSIAASTTASADGTAIAVKVYAGTGATGTPVQTLTATASGGAWTVTPTTALAANATYTAQASQTDGSGNTGVSSANSFVVDTASPAVTVTAPANGGSTNSSTPTFSGAAGSVAAGPTASADGVAITVKVYAGTTTAGTLVQTLSGTAFGGAWAVTPATGLVANASYTAQASQADGAGNTGVSSASTFTVDTVSPTVTVTAPASGGFTNGTTPTLVGAAGTAVGDLSAVTVKVYAGATATGTPVQTLSATASGGAWTVTPTTALAANATYTVQASQNDSAGNTGVSSAHSFVVDTVNPNLTLTVPANNAFTNDTTPTFSGAAGMVAAGATASADGSAVTVNVYAGTTTGGTLVQTLTATASGGTWSVTPTTALAANATYTAQASQADGAGNVGTSANTFTVDTVSPTVTLTAPASGGFINDTTPTLVGAAGTAVGDLSAVTVKVYAGATATGTPVQTLSATASGGAWTVTPTTALAANATYTVQASQNDSAGNTGVSSAHSFVIDTVNPNVTITAPSNGSFIRSTTPTFSGAAGMVAAGATASADGSAVTVNVYAGTTTAGTLVQTLTATASGGTWSVTPTTALAANATYTAQASQADGAGNVGTSANTFTVDTVSPTVTLTAPASGGFTNDTTPTLVGAAGTAVGDLSAVTIKLYAGATTTGTPVQTLTATASGGAWTVTPTTALAANATYTAQASQTDGSGNTGVSSANSFVVDTASPAVTMTRPSNGGSTNVNTPTFSGAAGSVVVSPTTSADGSAVTVRIYAGTTTAGTLVQTLTTTASNGVWSAAPATGLVANATYTAQASQADGAGNTGVSSASTFTVDTVSPTVTVTAPASGGFTNGTTPTLVGAAGTAVGDLSAVTVKVYAGATATGTPVQTLSATASGGAWTVTPTTALAANATYTVQASQNDSAGNTGVSSAHSFVIDTVNPNVTITAPSNGSFINTTTPTISGTAGTALASASASADGSLININVYAGANTGGTLLQTLTTTASGAAWSLTPPAGGSDGTYTIQALQSDGAGNVGTSAAVTIIVDTVKPGVTLTAPPNNGTIANLKPTFSGAAGTVAASSTSSADGSSITVKVYAGTTATGSAIQTLTTTASGGAWSVTPTTALSGGNGTYTAQASQNDGAGNTGISSANTFAISNGVAVTPSSTLFGSGYGAQERLAITNTYSITAMSITISVAHTTGVASSGQNNSYPGGYLAQTATTTPSLISYSYVLASGDTIVAAYSDGSGGAVIYAQFSGTGSPHLTSGDTWTVTSTSNGITSTVSGTF